MTNMYKMYSKTWPSMGELDPQAAADSRIFVRRKSAEKKFG